MPLNWPLKDLYIISKKKKMSEKGDIPCQKGKQTSQYDLHAASGKPCGTHRHTWVPPPRPHPLHCTGSPLQQGRWGWGLPAGGLAAMSLAPGRVGSGYLAAVPSGVDKTLVFKNRVGSTLLAWGHFSVQGYTLDFQRVAHFWVWWVRSPRE